MTLKKKSVTAMPLEEVSFNESGDDGDEKEWRCCSELKNWCFLR